MAAATSHSVSGAEAAEAAEATAASFECEAFDDRLKLLSVCLNELIGEAERDASGEDASAAHAPMPANRCWLESLPGRLLELSSLPRRLLQVRRRRIRPAPGSADGWWPT